MRRHKLSNFEWSVIKPLRPNKSRGMPRVDDWWVLSGVLWRFRTGSPWWDIRERYCPHTICHIRFVRRRKAVIWDHALTAIAEANDGDFVMIDSSCIRVHEHGATDKNGAATMAVWDVPVGV